MKSYANNRRVAVVESCVMTTLGLQHLLSLSGEAACTLKCFTNDKAWFSKCEHPQYDIVIYSIAGSRYSRQQSAYFLSRLAGTLPDAKRVLLADDERQARFIRHLLPVALHAVICKSTPIEQLSEQIHALMNWERQPILAQPGSGYGLSPTERKILQYIGRGFSTPEIAAKMARNIKTIRAHKFNLMKKLDVKSDAWLIDAADILGYLPLPAAE
ncbi:LuxR C-terminal-related transcriptional regulator [Enterobacter sp. CC120223-11]|uniref:LuxR C-terminal-related transcriptional regulator n=1 Tax=Enterobacter sp. CC120223-11 TaxID=1378073 RepID=UPI000BC45C6E|nr:LuxR C-terminal-related transcriptional regulator [Enterobacter sp. CC120223-11]SNY67588.1 DNA-binding response regulator, NarL/FixJ family, contains REC and HTH domains [Enterobacter sp. CC120223-11]